MITWANCAPAHVQARRKGTGPLQGEGPDARVQAVLARLATREVYITPDSRQLQLTDLHQRTKLPVTLGHTNLVSDAEATEGASVYTPDSRRPTH